MPTVYPFAGYWVATDRVGDVVAPSYDALTPAERHCYARTHPDNYVNAIRSPEEFPECERPSLDAVLDHNKQALDRLLANGAFRQMGEASLFVYRLRADSHEQFGIVGEVPVDDYDRGVIKPHENTRTGREDQLARYNEVVGASSSPVCLTYGKHPEVDTVVGEQTARDPDIDFVSEDLVRQSIWRIEEASVQARLRRCFAEVGGAYLTDGHHRAAAASRLARLRRRQNPAHMGAEAYNRLLVVLFPDDQMRILAYNRYVADRNGMATQALVDALAQEFRVERLGAIPAPRAAPSRSREFTMLVADCWYRLSIDPQTIPEADPVGSLDISILHDRILTPILGISDVRTDERCESVSGALGMTGLAGRCRAGGVAFACYPVSIEQLMAVADAGLAMPPKSTWFDPKVRSGLFLRLR